MTVLATGGEQTRWGDAEHLLAALVDIGQAALWQNGGGKGGRPKPLLRPGEQAGRKLGKAPPRSDAVVLLDRWRRGELDKGEEA